MKFEKNSLDLTSPYCDKGLEVFIKLFHCHSELVSESHNIKNPYGLTLTPTLSHWRGSAFTLAEVLIALVVIGVIAAITMTTVMPNISERANSQRQANIVYKVTQATDLMKANGAMVEGFASTDAFVDELQKYLKIMKRCDSEHIADCWPVKKVTDAEGNEYEVSKAKTREDLGFKDDNRSTKNVAIVLNDGASLIMTYNPASGGIGVSDKLTAQLGELPVGGGYKEFLEYTTNSTGGLAFIMDVNGGKGPNKESIKTQEKTKYYDIRNLNGAKFSKSFEFELITSPTAYDCTQNTTNKFCLKTCKDGSTYTGYSSDKWAGANNDCEALGGEIPSQSELQTICNSESEKAKYGLTDFNGYLWSSELNHKYVAAYASSVYFPSCDLNYTITREYPTPQALCIAK